MIFSKHRENNASLLCKTMFRSIFCEVLNLRLDNKRIKRPHFYNSVSEEVCNNNRL